jgi:dihydroxy-acid dehydratase
MPSPPLTYSPPSTHPLVLTLACSSHGFVIGHVVPEAALGGTLALVHDGDVISIDAVQNTLTLCVDDDELAQRRDTWEKELPHKKKAVLRGTLGKYVRLVADASQGCVTDGD